MPAHPPVLEHAYVTVVFPGGHSILGLTPAPRSGERRLYWAIHARPPRSVRFGLGMSYPPGTAEDLVSYIKDLVLEQFPPLWAEVVHVTDNASVAVHPVEDLSVSRYADGPFLLAGDAGAITRPHTASGAVKAIRDAQCLEHVLRTSSSREEIAARYDRERRVEGDRLMEIGRKIGRAQVEETPDWTRMGPAQMEAWTRATLAGYTHYLYGKPETGTPSPTRDQL